MSARRPVLSVLALLCVLACALVGGVGVAGAVTQFGSFGEGAGQLQGSDGVAVDQASGDVYFADPSNRRIDEFEASGSFVSAWGRGVLNGAKELQTCTTSCERGSEAGTEARGPGELPEGGLGIAVDNDPSSSSYQDVYVWDRGDHYVEKYDSTGKFLLEFKIKESSVSNRGPIIAVGPDGRVYVGAKAEVQVFEPSGVLSETISLAGLSSISTFLKNPRKRVSRRWWLTRLVTCSWGIRVCLVFVSSKRMVWKRQRSLMLEAKGWFRLRWMGRVTCLWRKLMFCMNR
jgi:hypothetical protein